MSPWDYALPSRLSTNILLFLRFCASDNNSRQSQLKQNSLYLHSCWFHMNIFSFCVSRQHNDDETKITQIMILCKNTSKVHCTLMIIIHEYNDVDIILIIRIWERICLWCWWRWNEVDMTKLSESQQLTLLSPRHARKTSPPWQIINIKSHGWRTLSGDCVT